jgi:hypothetical protein
VGGRISCRSGAARPQQPPGFGTLLPADHTTVHRRDSFEEEIPIRSVARK